MKTVLTAAFATLLLSLTSVSAFASTQDIRAADKAVEFDVGGSYMKYGESVNRATFDTETGWMPSLDLGLTWLMPEKASWSYLDNVYFHVDGQASFGGVRYNGGVRVFSGNSFTDFPFSTTSDEQIYHVVGKVGKWFELYNGVALTPYLDVGYRGWQRSVNGGPFNAGAFGTLVVGTSAETYEHFESGGGLLLQASPMERLVLSVSGQLGSTFGATMRNSGATFNLGSRPVWQVAGGVGYAITPDFELVANARLDGFGYNKSALLQVGNFIANEPDSYTHQMTVMGGLAYHLK